MTSLFEGRGAEDGRIASGHAAPATWTGDRRAMTLPGLLGAWLRRLRSPVFRPGSSRPGGAPRRGLLPVALPCLAFAAALAGAAAAQEVSLSESRYGVWEGNSVVIGVGIDNPKPTAFTLDYTLSGGTASGADVAGGFGTRSITVPKNARTASISIATVQDSIQDEGTETFSVRLSTSEPGIVFGRGTAEVSISDDDTTPTLTFESASSSVDEGAGTHDVTVRLSPAPTTKVELAIEYAAQHRIRHPLLQDGSTATPGSDYVIPHSRSYRYNKLSIIDVPAGATTVTVPVTIVDDSDPEGDETVVLRYYGTTYSIAGERDHRGRYFARSRTPHGRHTLTIVDNEPRVSFASASQRVSEESGTRDVEVRLNKAPTSDLTLAYTVGGTATAGSDFTIADSGTVTVPKGATAATIPVTIVDDSAPESSETVVLKLVGNSGYGVGNPGTHTLTIAEGPQMSFASASQRVGEESGTHNVGVTLSPAPTTAVTVTYTVGGTATAGSDFTIADSGTVTVPKGATTAVIPVTLIDDSEAESAETVDLTLAASGGYGVVSPGTHTLTIVDDELTVSFASAAQSVGEGSGTHDVGVTLSPAPTTAVTFTYTVGGTAAAGSDFTIADSGTVTVPAGATTAAIPVTLIDDTEGESGETVVLTLAASGGYQVVSPDKHTLTIVDDEPSWSLSKSRYGVWEGNTVTLWVFVDHPRHTAFTLDYTLVGGTASGADVVGGFGTRSITVPKNAWGASISIATAQDSIQDEGTETFSVRLSTSEPGIVFGRGTAEVSISDDDTTPTVTFESASSSVDEGAGTHDVTVRLSPAPTTKAELAIEYAAQRPDIRHPFHDGSTATPGSDYVIPHSRSHRYHKISRIGVPAGATTVTVPVTIVDDSDPEGDETIVLRYYNIAFERDHRGRHFTRSRTPHVTHTLTIVDNEPIVSFASASQSVGEGSGTRNVGVTLDKAPTSDITVKYTVGGTATAGSDFTIADSGTVTVPAGATTATIPVTIVDDSAPESSKTVVLTLAGGSGYSAVNPGTHTLTILDNDPAMSFASASQSAGEGSGTHDVGVTLGKAPTSDITVKYTVDGTATPGADFTIASSGTVTVLAGATTATIPVTLLDDTVGEGDETVVLTLAASGGYQVVSPGTHTLTIVDNEPAVSFASASQRVDEGSGTHDVGVTLGKAPTSDITVKYTVDGTATAGSDFTIADSGTVTVLAGATTATIPVTLIDDTAPESNETVVLALAASGGYQVTSPGTHVLTIAANDAQPPATSSVSFASGTYRVNEGGDLRPELELSHWRAEDVTVKVEALDLGGAKSGTDFAAGPWRVTIPAGERRWRFGIATFDDDAREPDEEFLLHIAPYGHSDGVRIDTDDQLSAIAVIYDDTRVSLPETEYTVTEGATATVRVSIANPMAKAFTLDYTLSGAGGASDADVAGGLGARSVTVPAKAKRVDLAIATVQDAVQGEVGESVEVALSTTEPGVEFAARTVVVRIADDDSPAVAFASSASRAGEGAGTHDVTVNLSSAPDTPLAVPYTVTGTAVSGTDYTALSGTLTVPASATTATVPVAIVDDTAREGDETVVLTLAAGTTHTVGARDTHTLTIADNDTPTVTFAQASQHASEGAGTRTVTVTLSVAQATPLALAYTVGGTATPGADFTIADSGTLTVPAGTTTATIPVALINDNVDDPDETVVLTLVAGEGYRVGTTDTHTLYIDFLPLASFRDDYWSTVREDSGRHDFRVKLEPAPPSPLTLAYEVSGTATSGADYQALSGTVSVPAGAATATIPVTLIDDAHEDSGESVVLRLVGGTGYRVADKGSGPWASARYWERPWTHHVVWILNHDAGDLESLLQAQLDQAVAGGDAALASLCRRALALVRGETPPDGLAPLTEAEARARAGVESSRGEAARAALWRDLAHLAGAVTTEPEVTLAAGTSPVTEGGSATFTLTATPPPASALAVTVAIATDGDWGIAAGSRTVTLPTTGSATLTLPTTDDATDEPHGSVSATVTGGDGYTVGSAASGSITIEDDDAPATPDWTDYQTVVSYLVEVRDNPKNTAVKGNAAHIAKWNRVLEALGHDTGTGVAPMAASVIHANAAQWPDSPFRAASVYLKSQEQQQEPAVTVSAGTSPVTEGGSASFTLTATPPPAADLAVSVTVAADGDWGVTVGSRTVTIPTTGSATLTLATTGDTTDEPDGSVTVTVTDGAGYTVGASASGSITIEDDDAPATTPDWTDYQTVVSYLIEVRDNPKNTAVKGNPVHIAKWNRVLEAVGHDTGTGVAPMAASEIHANAAQWPDSPFKAASVYLKSQEQQQEPAVTVSAGTSPVTEGADASFTLTATPPPAADLAVNVTVATDGDYGITAGSRTVTIPPTGSATLTLATTGDTTDEPHGSVSVTVTDGDGYTVGSSASGSVTVRDDDEPPPDTPAVTIAAGTSPVTEGGAATFTVTATPAPAADLPVAVTVTTAGDWGVTAGSQTVTIDTTGSATLTLATTGDATDEPDGSVTVTVTDGSGYTVGDPASDTVAVRDDDVPVVTIAADAASVTEGGSASFTLTANPVPAAPLAVSVTVATAGDYGVTAGSQTVTIDTTGSATLTLATTDDTTDEPDGSATVTVQTGSGYTVGTPASGTVAVRDDDLPPPVVTIAAKAASVTEGGDAVFTLTADRAPAAALTVELAVSETGEGDHVAASDEGPATVTIAKDTTEAVFTLATVNDAVDEPDTSATVTVQPGAGYTVGAPASASVEVTDDDAPSTVPALSVGDSTAKEGDRLPVMPFTVRLSSPAQGPVRVHVSTRPSTPVSARPGQDYAPGSSDLTFRAGETEKQVWILIYDDSHDEGAETFEVVLSQAKGATIGDGVAVGTIVNDDPMPAAWLARFGRTVAEQALDGIAGRMAAPRTAGMQGTLAGRALDFDAPAGGAPGTWSGAGPGAGDAANGAPTLAGTGALALADIAQASGGSPGRDGHGGIDDGFGHDAAGFGETHAQSMTAREALLGSSFSLTGERDGAGGSMAFWGRASRGSFDGREGTFSLDGEATTALLGADYARGKWLVGLALTQSTGEGEYRDTKVRPRPPSQDCPPGETGPLCDDAVRAGNGEVEASLTAALPWASVQASERLKLWGAVGYGAGEVTLETAMDGRYRADTSWSMAAAGLRGELLGTSPEGAGPALALTSDALWARTSSEQTRDLAASDSDATRLRLGLEGSWRMALEGGGSLAPKLELGARHDGGDAETGFGVELGGGLAWSDPALGLTLDVSGRTLLAHENDDLKDRGYAASLGFDPSPASERGPSLSLRQELGARATGGLDALFAPEPLEDRTGSDAASRWSMEAAYGVPAFGGRFTGSPHVGLGLSAAARDYTLGWRWTPEAARTPDLSFGLKATRRESDAAKPEHTLGFEIRATW